LDGTHAEEHRRAKGSSMKIGIDSYCFHRFFGEVYEGTVPPEKPMTLDDFLAFAGEVGVDGVSLESCFLPSMEAAWLRALGAKLDGYGLDRVYAWGHPFGLEDGTNRAAFDDMVRQIGNAALIGAQVMRVTPGPGPGDFHWAPRQPRLEVLARWYGEAVAVARRSGVRLAAENHGDYCSDEMLWLVEAVGSPYFGVTFDTGNFLYVGDNPVQAMEKLARHTYATHIKDPAVHVKVQKGLPPSTWSFLSDTAIGEGLVDMERVLQLLAQAGYTGLLAVEIASVHPAYENKEELAVRRSIDALRRMVGNIAETARQA
jgi:sugar phosphate isomerase/epimerase